MSKLAWDLTNKWQRYTVSQKSLLIYSVVLLLLLVTLPIIRIDQLTSQVDTFTLFNWAMTKTRVLTLFSIGFLFAWNASYKFKKLTHQIFGFAGNDTLVNTTLIFILLMLFFSVGDTVGLIKLNFKYGISTTRWFLFIGFYLIVWLLGTLAMARIHHKKSLKSAEISITRDQHTETQKAQFQQHSRPDHWGLFDEESEDEDMYEEDTDEYTQEAAKPRSSQLF